MLWHISYQINSTQFRLASWSKTNRIQNTTWETRTPHLQALFFWFPPFLAISFNPTPELPSPANRCLLSPCTQWVPSQQRAAPVVTCYFPLRDIINKAPKAIMALFTSQFQSTFCSQPAAAHILLWQLTNLHQDLAERQPVQWKVDYFSSSVSATSPSVYLQKRKTTLNRHTFKQRKKFCFHPYRSYWFLWRHNYLRNLCSNPRRHHQHLDSFLSTICCGYWKRLIHHDRPAVEETERNQDRQPNGKWVEGSGRSWRSEGRDGGISSGNDRQHTITRRQREGCGKGFNDVPKVERGITPSPHFATGPILGSFLL